MFELVFDDDYKPARKSLLRPKKGRPPTSKSGDPSFAKCASCKNYVKVVDYAINKQGKRKKTCQRCLDNNKRRYNQERQLTVYDLSKAFEHNLLRDYDLTLDDIKDYVYVGGDGICKDRYGANGEIIENKDGKRKAVRDLEYFYVNFPTKEPLPHRDYCICDTGFSRNVYVANQEREYDSILVIGCCCVKKFMKTGMSKTCSRCSKPHMNRKDNHCKSCRVIMKQEEERKRKNVKIERQKKLTFRERGLCPDCQKPYNNKYPRCYSCNISYKQSHILCPECSNVYPGKFDQCYDCYNNK